MGQQTRILIRRPGLTRGLKSPAIRSKPDRKSIKRTTNIDGTHLSELAFRWMKADHAGQVPKRAARLPAEVEINPGQKLVTIYLLCRVELTETGIRVYQLPD